MESKRACCTDSNTHDGSSIESLWASLLDECRKAPGFEPGNLEILRSLILPFLSFLLFKNKIVIGRERIRLVKSIVGLSQRIWKYKDSFGREQQYVKYATNVLMCKVFRDDQRPPFPAWLDPIDQNLFSGWLKVFINRRVNRRDVSFIYSLDKGSKQVWPDLPDCKVKLELEESRALLTRDPRPLHRRQRFHVRRVARQLFDGFQDDNQSKCNPSSRACLQASLRDGGATALYPRFALPSADELTGLHRLHFLNESYESWRREIYVSAVYNAGLVARSEKELDTDLGKIYAPEIQCVKVSPILEPGKVRIVSVGDGYSYTALQRLQGSLLRAWKSSPYSTMLKQDLLPSILRMDEESDFPYWCSGDYKGATDREKREVSLTQLDVLQSLGYADVDLARATMSTNYLIYPKKYGIEPGVSREGQLMGHPLSFPLLCAANLTVFRECWERYVEESVGEERSLRIQRRAQNFDLVLINGDDILFKCDDRLYELFLEVSKTYGFEISQGKNFKSPDCCVINSKVFIRRNGQMKAVDYLNQRYLSRKTPTGYDRDQSLPHHMAEGINRMLELAPWTAPTLPLIMARSRRIWNGPFQPNWFMPLHLGGFGIDPKHSPKKLEVTKNQRLIAARFIHEKLSLETKRYGDDVLRDHNSQKALGKLMKVFPHAKNHEVWVEQEESDVPGRFVEISFRKKEKLGLPYSMKIEEWNSDLFGHLNFDLSERKWRELPIKMENPPDWSGRFAAIANSTSSPTAVPIKSPVQFLRPWQTRLTPLTDYGIEKYWNKQMVAFPTIPCPPLAKIPAVDRPIYSENLARLGYHRAVGPKKELADLSDSATRVRLFFSRLY